MHLTSWIVKLSKLCNLRCGYCYEWDELSDPRRMSLELWERVLTAVATMRELDVKRFGAAKADVVLHGGEPLILPLDYLESLMEVKRRVLGDDPGFTFSVQTNLYKLTPQLIDFLKRNDFGVGVSSDVVPGVRLSLAGRETGAAVLANMERLEEAGIQYGAITVLAAHTAPHIEAIYESFASRRIPLRILPLLMGADARPFATFGASNDALVGALERVFERWIEGGRPIPLFPFDSHLETVLRKMLRLEGPMLDRESQGEHVLIVGVDGALNRFDDTYEATSLGSLASQTLPELFASSAYQASFAEDAAVLKRTCGSCEYSGACTGWPAFTAKHPDDGLGRCPVAYRFNRFIERYLTENGFTADELRSLVGERLDEAQAPDRAAKPAA